MIDPVAVTVTVIFKFPVSTADSGILILKLSLGANDVWFDPVWAFTTIVPVGALFKDTV